MCHKLILFVLSLLLVVGIAIGQVQNTHNITGVKKEVASATTGSYGMVLKWNPTTGRWVAQEDSVGSGAGIPGGSNTYVQFNDSGVFGGDAGMVYNKTTGVLTFKGAVIRGAVGGSDTLQTWRNSLGQTVASLDSVGVFKATFRVDSMRGDFTYLLSDYIWSQVTGTAAAPSCSWESDTDTGIYRIGPNRIGITAKGVNVLIADSSGVSFAVACIDSLSVMDGGISKVDLVGPFGIQQDEIVEIDGADIADNEYARFTANGLESRTAAEVAQDIDANIVETGTVAAGTWASNISLGDDENITLVAPGSLSDLKAVGTITTLTAGYTTAIGDIVVLDPADSKLTLADCDVEGTTGDCGIYVALEVKNDAQACLVLVEGWMRDDASYNFTAGKAVFVGNTGGEATTTQSVTAGDFLRIIGHSFNADVFYFDPSYTWVELE